MVAVFLSDETVIQKRARNQSAILERGEILKSVRLIQFFSEKEDWTACAVC